jgi:hypothetical protein
VLSYLLSLAVATWYCQGCTTEAKSLCEGFFLFRYLVFVVQRCLFCRQDDKKEDTKKDDKKDDKKEDTKKDDKSKSTIATTSTASSTTTKATSTK